MKSCAASTSDQRCTRPLSSTPERMAVTISRSMCGAAMRQRWSSTNPAAWNRRKSAWRPYYKEWAAGMLDCSLSDKSNSENKVLINGCIWCAAVFLCVPLFFVFWIRLFIEIRYSVGNISRKSFFFIVRRGSRSQIVGQVHGKLYTIFYGDKFDDNNNRIIHILFLFEFRGNFSTMRKGRPA